MSPNEIRPQPNFIMRSTVLRLYVTVNSSYILEWKKIVVFQLCVSVRVACIQSVQDIRLASSYIHISCLESFIM